VQQLTGLQRLTVEERLVMCEQGVWLAPLTALTHLCVLLNDPQEGLPEVEAHVSSSAAQQRQQQQQQWVGGPTPAAGQLLEQVQVWPPGLQQLVLWAALWWTNRWVMPRHWRHTPQAPGSVPFDVWWEQEAAVGSPGVAQGWARPFRPCPHLPGVWELQGECKPT